MQEESPTPLHTITIDGVAFTIRRDFHGRIRPYAVKDGGLEQGVGRMQGYSSVKEAFDAIYVRELQD